MKHIENLDELLNSLNVNESVITLDNFIAELCSHGVKIYELSEPQKFFFYNQALESEINNGGFDQYFFNSTGQYAHETVESLRKIGAYRTADILQLAIEQFPDGNVPKNRDERINAMKQIEKVASEIWEELDQKFYAYEDDLNSLNLAYVRQNKDSF